ncbi:MAG: DMT family transporter [Proteobacteria bacterium]|nr:DMT family transporter [Pseudomonadota bacterium]
MYNKLSDEAQGIFWAITSCFFMTLTVVLARKIWVEVHILQILFMRNLFAVMFMTPLMFRGDKSPIGKHTFKYYGVLSLNGFFALMVWFYSITLLEIPEAMSLTFMVPIFTTLLAMMLLKERVSNKIWIALMVGIVGIMVIVRPGFNQFQTAYLWAIVATFLWAGSNIIIKILSKSETSKNIVFYKSFFMLFLSAPLAVPYFTIPSATNLILLAALGIFSSATYFSVSTAYKKTDIAILQPFDFSRMIFASILAYFMFGELVDIWEILGSVIILLSSVYLTQGKDKKGNLL